MLHKFGSNLDLKTNGNSVIAVNSIHRLSYMAGDLLRRSWRIVAICGVALAREKAPSWLPLASWLSFKSRDAVVVVLLSPSVFTAAAVAIAPLSFCHCRSAFQSLVTLATAPLVPCALSRTILDACLHREPTVHAFLPRGRQPHRRGRVIVARALR